MVLVLAEHSGYGYNGDLLTEWQDMKEWWSKMVRSMSHIFSHKSQSLIYSCSTASSLKSLFALKGIQIDCMYMANTQAYIAGRACWLILSHLCPCLAHTDVCSSCFSCIILFFFLKILTRLACICNVHCAYASIINYQYWNGPYMLRESAKVFSVVS